MAKKRHGSDKETEEEKEEDEKKSKKKMKLIVYYMLQRIFRFMLFKVIVFKRLNLFQLICFAIWKLYVFARDFRRNLIRGLELGLMLYFY